ncbi:hypothetical protein SETIT_9G104000v2 [Setaria italica]|uniref:Bowman-Birk serine protease inhibitors family domain-containing protein n=1 Tax=Setaria italica TaxID=4555 RepID=K4ALW9_SETIT|nr:hypothetical protein SETIT_9G104000v2 [Setaria italica]
MASMKVSFAFILLLSGLLVLSEMGSAEAACPVRCIQGSYITCGNYPSKQLGGCDCQCAPKDGKNCRLHFLSTGGTFDCPKH